MRPAFCRTPLVYFLVTQTMSLSQKDFCFLVVGFPSDNPIAIGLKAHSLAFASGEQAADLSAKTGVAIAAHARTKRQGKKGEVSRPLVTTSSLLIN
jgi:hypothetical protein